jgi:hypothetical protein
MQYSAFTVIEEVDRRPIWWHIRTHDHTTTSHDRVQIKREVALEPELPWYAAINRCIGPLSDGSAIFEYTCNTLVSERCGKASFHLHSSPVCVIEDAPVLPKDGKDSFIARRVGPRLPGSST